MTVKDSQEAILLADDATLKLGMWRDCSLGKVYLTPTKIIWRSSLPMIIRVFSCFAPAQVEIDIPQITRIRRFTDLRRAWLVLDAGGKTYALRPGRLAKLRGILQDNPATTQRWLEAIEWAREELRKEQRGAEPANEGTNGPD
jgi:hypothetical protein